MHSMGLHSALAINRQRKRRREQRRAKERRFSLQSTESHSSCASPRNSIDGEHGHRFRKTKEENKPNGFETKVGIGMLQIGIVFFLLGIFLLGSGLVPDDFSKWRWQTIFTKEAWWNELVVTGAFSLLLGIFLMVLHKFISKREEEDLNEYVQRQLTRSRSGHRLVRDVETGNLTTKRTQNQKATTPIGDDFRLNMVEEIPNVHSPKVKSPPATCTSPPSHYGNGEVGVSSPQLEKIMEEEVSLSERATDVDVGASREECDSTTASVSPGSPSETQELLVGTANYTVVNNSVPSKYHQVRMTKI